LGLTHDTELDPQECLKSYDPCFMNAFTYFKQHHFEDNFQMQDKRFSENKIEKTD